MLINNNEDTNYESLFEQLMKDHGESLARLAITYVHDRSKAEDIVQDVFLKAFKNLGTFRGDSDIKTWLYRITINRCKDELRSWSFRKLLFTNEIFDKEVSKNEATPELKLITKHEKQQLGRAILSLPIKFREVIILYYYQDLSIEQIAKLLNISQNTVKTRLFRARNKLAQIIPQLEEEE